MVLKIEQTHPLTPSLDRAGAESNQL